jgi:TDG/mug DNA glycosylase family protein
VERATVEVYETRGEEWAARVRPVRTEAARRLAAAVPAGGIALDVGCGTGRYTAALGPRVVGLDAAATMLARCRDATPGVPLVQADLEALPFGAKRLHGAWANMAYHHLPAVRLPMALFDLHRVLEPGAPLDLQMVEGDYEGDALPGDDVGGRFFASWRAERLADVVEGAGFDHAEVEVDGHVVRVRAVRARTLADTVGPGMRLLVVGLNPSLYAADAGVGFARPGNRFWPSALAAGLVDRALEPGRALARHGIGMTDLVKRATPRADALAADEFRRGLARVERLVAWLAPGAVCMVGLAGWRAGVDPKAAPGPQARRLGGRPVYVMPSTSGANAHASPAVLTEHLRRAAELAGTATSSGIHDHAERMH